MICQPVDSVFQPVDFVFQPVVFVILYVDFIKTKSGKIKFNFTVFNWFIFKISQLISLHQILFLISDALMLF